MNEGQIIRAIADACQDDTLQFQIIIQDNILYVYINRKTESSLAAQKLTDTIYSAITSLDLLELKEVWIYSRILGQVEPDWHTFIKIENNNIAEIKTLEYIPEKPESKVNTKIPKLNTEEIETNSVNNQSKIDLAKPESVEISEQTEIDVDSKQYCFIRNQRLLTADLVPPKENIAQLVKTFHQFNESIKQHQLPILDSYFQNYQNPDITNFEPEIQTWWNDILKLSSDEYRKIAIWLSRYCLDSEQTISTIETVFAAQELIKQAHTEAELEEKEKQKNYIDRQEANLDSSSKYYRNNQNKKRNYKSESQPASIKNINKILPIIWTIITLSIVISDINKSSEAVDIMPTICQNIIEENQSYCKLAGEMVGEEALTNIVESLPPPFAKEDYLFTEYLMGKGLGNCGLYGNIAAGIPLKEAIPSKNPLLSESSLEILPNFYVADVEQTNLETGNPTVRTVCFFYRVDKISNKKDIKFLEMDQIDTEWPEVTYEPSERVKSLHSLNKSLGTYSFLSNFGLNTLFTAIAIYIVAILGMAISANSIETIYQASFILGIVESLLATLPIFGWFISIPLECIALGITSGCIKGFNIDWNEGYRSVASTALLLLVIRGLFYWLTLALLFHIFS